MGLWVVEVMQLLHVQIVLKDMVIAGVMEIADGLMQDGQQPQYLYQQLLPQQQQHRVSLPF